MNIHGGCFMHLTTYPSTMLGPRRLVWRSGPCMLLAGDMTGTNLNFSLMCRSCNRGPGSRPGATRKPAGHLGDHPRVGSGHPFHPARCVGELDDLVPQLIATVKGAAANEEKILMEVTNARSGIKSATTPEEIQQQGSIINRNIQVVFEKYPEIRSTENFGMLQAQLEGTENQVKTERDLYNEAVKEFNSYVRGFWKHKALGLVGNDDEEFKVRKMFEADAGSENAPKVSFE